MSHKVIDARAEPHWKPYDARLDAPIANAEHRYVYLWHWPIRAMHWAAAISIVVLFITGFYIGRPYFMPASSATPSSFALQYVRLAHFVAAAVLVTTAVVRLYWLAAGNRFERLPALFPIRPRDWVNMFKMVKYYLLIHPERAPRYLGHNPLQQTFYTVTYGFAGLLALTGFILFGEASPGGFFMHTFGRLAPLLGGMQMVRVIHHVAAWYFPMFVVFHIYLALRAELLERSGTMSSIFSGGRFVPADEEYVDG